MLDGLDDYIFLLETTPVRRLHTVKNQLGYYRHIYVKKCESRLSVLYDKLIQPVINLGSNLINLVSPQRSTWVDRRDQLQ